MTAVKKHLLYSFLNNIDALNDLIESPLLRKIIWYNIRTNVDAETIERSILNYICVFQLRGGVIGTGVGRLFQIRTC